MTDEEIARQIHAIPLGRQALAHPLLEAIDHSCEFLSNMTPGQDGHEFERLVEAFGGKCINATNIEGEGAFEGVEESRLVLEELRALPEDSAA